MAVNKIIISKNPIFDKCPSCKEWGSLHRSRARTLMENIFKMFPLWNIFRCKECGWRGYRFTFTFTSKSLRVVSLYCVLIFITVIIVRFALSYFIK